MLKTQNLKCCVNGLIHFARHDKHVISNTKKSWAPCLHSYATASSTELQLKDGKWPPEEDVKVIIPKRIPRGPTSILEALANTVDQDPTNPTHYLIDDPNTLSFGRTAGKLFYLSEDSGRKAAMHAINSWPNLLQHDQSAPTVKAFTPKITEYADTEECLEESIKTGKVKDAKEIFTNMIAAGTAISDEVKLMYLDTLCRYNCRDEEYYPSMEQRFFRNTPRDTWKPDYELMGLFEELCDKYPQAYISIICGAAKYRGHEMAHKFYTQALENQIIFPIEVHNSVLSGLTAALSDFEGVTKGAERILVYLEEHGIRPNLSTFNEILCQLKLLPPFTPRHQYGLTVIKEMSRCGIKPSPASYLHFLNMIYRTSQHKRYTDLLLWMINDLEKQRPIQIRDPQDCYFFRVAMSTALEHNDPEAGHRLFEMAWKGSNSALLGNMSDRYRFHNYYMKLLIQTEPLEEVMEIYTKICPKIILLENEVFVALYDIIELYEGYQYVRQIFEDLKETLLIVDTENWQFTKLLTANNVKSEIHEEFARIADDMYVFSQTAFHRRAEHMISAQVFSHFIELALNMKRVEKAVDWFTKYRETAHGKHQLHDAKAFVMLAEALIAAGRLEDMMHVLQVLVDLGFNQALAHILKDKEFPAEYRNRVGLFTAEIKPFEQEKYQHPRTVTHFQRNTDHKTNNNRRF